MPARPNYAYPLLLLFLLAACDTGSSNPTPPNKAKPTLTVRDDLPLLHTRINLPTTITAARWTVLPMGTSSTSEVPGPTDTILYAYLTATGANPLSFGALPRQGSPLQSVTLPSEVAEALIPPADLGTVVKKPGSYQMQGIAYDPSYFDLGSYRGLFAVKLPDGMLVAMQTE